MEEPSSEFILVLEESMLDRFVGTREIFGCLLYFVNRNMYAGVHEACS